METTEPVKDFIEVIRLSSFDPRAVKIIKGRELCFSFVDGLHEYQACLSDIRACWKSPLIVVDDITWSADVKRAFFEGAADRARIVVPELHEGYIL